MHALSNACAPNALPGSSTSCHTTSHKLLELLGVAGPMPLNVAPAAAAAVTAVSADVLTCCANLSFPDSSRRAFPAADTTKQT